MRKTLLVLPVLALTLGACGTTPGTDIAGNSVKAASPASQPAPASTTATDSDTGEDADDASDSTGGAKTVSFGTAATVTQDGQDAADLTVSAPTRYTREPGAYGSKAEKGQFLVYKISMQARDGISDTINVNPYDFYVRSEDGDHYDGAFASFDPELHATSLNPGEKIRGNIVFDVPKTGGMTLVYAPASTALAEWQS